MKNEDSNLWLKKLINTEKFDAWQAVSFLYRYPTIGIHEYICKKLKYTDNATIVIPQLVHIFLYHSDSDVSKPIYNLLKYWSIKSRKFFLSLYFYLKSSIDNVENKKSIQCFFLICDMIKNEDRIRSRNTKMLEVQLKYGRKIHRTIGLGKEKKSFPDFDGIFLFLLRSVSWVVDLKMFKQIRDYEKVFQQTKNVSKINFKADLSSGNAFKSDSIKSSIMFIESLIEISNRLKKLPKNFRQKGLEMELKLLNCNLPGKLTLPFFNTKYVLSVRAEYSNMLSSADNTPYLVAFELADETKPKKTFVNEELKNAAFLMQQLNAVSGLAYISDINNIRENVIVSLEKILEAERFNSETNSINLERLNIKPINKKINEKKKHIMHSKKKSEADCNDPFEDTALRIITEYKNDVNQETGDVNFNKELNTPDEDMKTVFFSEDETGLYDTNSQQEPELGLSTEIVVDEPSSNYEKIYQNEWDNRENNLRKSSEFSGLKNWKLVSLIVKTGCSLKQEIIAYQILCEMKKIWEEEKKDIWIKVYQIYFVNNNAGLVETIQNAYSIHKIKEMGQQVNRNYTLKTYFIEKFGADTEEYRKATHNFLISLVGYSIASYLLQIKDRHNGNILLDTEGYIIHVDFGFILGDHPGFYCVEIAPFKFSNDYDELLKDFIEDFKILFLEGFCALRKHSERLCRIIEMLSENSDLKCINKRVLLNFKDRLKLEMSDKEIESYVLFLINKSFNSMGTGLYDSFQYFSNGYL
jgi:phosphatidylinositol 4-kinase B